MGDIAPPSALCSLTWGLWVSSLDEREKGSEVPVILRTERIWRKVSGLLAFLLCEERGVGVGTGER